MGFYVKSNRVWECKLYINVDSNVDSNVYSNVDSNVCPIGVLRRLTANMLVIELGLAPSGVLTFDFFLAGCIT